MHRQTMVTGVYLLVVGVILAVIGFATNAPKTVVWDHGFNVSQNIEYTKNVDKFSNVIISGNDGNVEVKSGDSFKVYVKGDKRQIPKYKIRQNTLFINKQTRAKAGIITQPQRIVVTVPKDEKLDMVEANVSQDDISLNGITVNKLIVNSSSDSDYGWLYINNSRVLKSSKMNLNTYHLQTFNTEMNNLTLDAGELPDDYSAGNDADDIDYEDTVVDSIHLENSSFTNAKLSLDHSDIYIEDSTLSGTKSKSSHSRVKMDNSVLKGVNEFTISSGLFSGRKNKIDGYDLSTNKGTIKFLGNRIKENQYQVNQNVDNLLRVNGERVRIVIK
ncbi:DUF4097 family beta strand repeat-containing protein [Companilactobacillus ginsenosidimutans]|uniref:DUF4097 domain-containing protein n=1 Tax=Companilactobacillus ginsenosidimutans TaxID=1007676 RepID=A0A0H4QFE6_9LACO|nr:DUF4097 family beta strand repeat-containing protein [Companilactobacillus ginsenosidimutans]AKP67129.1 hypothetical protein ABM34_05985 [Companilactobacillus ginsenosidimutans]